MFDNNMVVAIIRAHLKVVIIVITVYFVANIIVGINAFADMAQLSKIVQNCVSLNGYLTKYDEDMVREIIDKYYGFDEDGNKRTGAMDEEGPNIVGIGKVIRNVRMYVYDPVSKEGGNFPLDLGDSAGNVYATSERMRYKKQKGELLFAGVSFDYYIMIPFGYWKTSTDGYTTIPEDYEDDISRSGNTGQQQWENFNQSEIGNDIAEGTNFMDATTKGGLFKAQTSWWGSDAKQPLGSIKTYISPVICTQYYPDIESNTNYSNIYWSE